MRAFYVEMVFLKIIWLISILTLCGRFRVTKGDQLNEKLNMIGFTENPTCGNGNSDAVNIRGYTLGSDQTLHIVLKFKQISNCEHSEEIVLCGSNPNIVCQIHNLPGSAESREAKIYRCPLGTPSDMEFRFGVFTVYAQKNGRHANATIIVHYKHANPKPIIRSKTVSVGDRKVTLGITTNVSIGNLRWAKDGQSMPKWNSFTSIVFERVTLNDSGVYECYVANQWKSGTHAFMQLIVRECPRNKWDPPNCNNQCKRCYNGGVCDTHIGTCICPSGFIGTNCNISIGGNRLGRDGDIPCKRSDNDGCRGKLVCPPLPQGCACHAGWKGLDCRRGCEDGMYGADCLQKCHCDKAECDKSFGCNEDSSCDYGYMGSRCLEKIVGNVYIDVKLTWNYHKYNSMIVPTKVSVSRVAGRSIVTMKNG